MRVTLSKPKRNALVTSVKPLGPGHTNHNNMIVRRARGTAAYWEYVRLRMVLNAITTYRPWFSRLPKSWQDRNNARNRKPGYPSGYGARKGAYLRPVILSPRVGGGVVPSTVAGANKFLGSLRKRFTMGGR